MTSSSSLKLGFIGAGFIGQLAHLDNFLQVNNCKLVALAEYRDDLREQVAVKYKIPQTYNTHTELLEHADVDAVIVVTARPHTVDVVADCLVARKHVLSEKPIAPNLESARRLVDLAKQYNVTYCVGYMKRYDSGVLIAKQKIEELTRTQELGKLLHVRAACYMGDSYCKANGYIQSNMPRLDMPDETDTVPNWLKKEDKPLFSRYVNVYSHVTNLLQFFFKAQPSVDYFNFKHSCAHSCILNYGDFLVSLDTGEVDQRDWQEEIIFIFQKGTLSLKLPPALLKNVPASVIVEMKVNNNMQKIELLADWSWSFFNQANRFVADILDGKDSDIDCRYSLQDLELIENIWKKTC